MTRAARILAKLGAFALGLSGAMTLAGCDQGREVAATSPGAGGATEAVGARLNCPEQSGDLKRLSVAADGSACQYRGPDEEKVDLNLVGLNGADARAALAPFEAALKADGPPVSDGQATVKVDAEDNGGDHDRANIDLPGIHIHADGDKAQIQIPGVSINADGDRAQVHAGLPLVGKAVVNAGRGGAEIRAGGLGPQGADLTYVLASDNPGPAGYRAVGYVARGPASGPLVVASFRAREQNRGGGHGIHGLDHLLALNASL